MLYVLLSVFTALGVFCALLGIAFLKGRNPVEEMLTARARGSLAGALGRVLEHTSFLHRFVSLEAVERDLRRSGWRFSVQEFLGLWFGVGLSSLLAAAVLVSARPALFFFAIPLPLLGFALPRFLLSQKAAEMQKQLEKEFIVFVEKTAICVAAGVPLLKVLAQQGEVSGPLAAEVRLAVEEAAGGRLDLALERFASRVDTEAARDFAASVGNALRHGSSGLSVALLAQAKEIRRAREMKIEEVARKMETKTLIPVVLAVMPAAAVLLLGPLAVGLVRMLR
ncbi:MAG: type II secretion system F family protein [Bacillota bacterium]